MIPIIESEMDKIQRSLTLQCHLVRASKFCCEDHVLQDVKPFYLCVPLRNRLVTHPAPMIRSSIQTPMSSRPLILRRLGPLQM